MALDKNYLNAYAVMSDGSRVALYNHQYSVSPTSLSKGNNTVTATHTATGYTCTFNVYCNV